MTSLAVEQRCQNTFSAVSQIIQGIILNIYSFYKYQIVFVYTFDSQHLTTYFSSIQVQISMKYVKVIRAFLNFRFQLIQYLLLLLMQNLKILYSDKKSD